jgi:hypothetical protein
MYGGKNMLKNLQLSILPIFSVLLLIGCMPQSNQSIINHYAEALLTKNNELQFRFKINENIFKDETIYKIKVSIHNEKLANALGTTEIYYGEESVYKGEYLEVENTKDAIIYMSPIPLQTDLHTFELEQMIVNEKAVTVEVIADEEVLATASLTNFSSQF